jgi:ubiquinone/menaquinone biosynthesis C-methylase UbiE
MAEERARQEGRWGRIAADRWAAVDDHAGRRVLDVGCSDGAYVERLRAEGRTAFGLDLLRGDPWSGSPAPFGVADATALPVTDGAVDTVIAFEVLEHVTDPGAALAEWRRVAGRNLVLSVPDCETPDEVREAGFTLHHWVDRTHVNFFTRTTLAAAATAAGWRVLEVRPIRPASPAYLLLRSLGLPKRLAGPVARVVTRISRRRYHLSLLLVAEA